MQENGNGKGKWYFIGTPSVWQFIAAGCALGVICALALFKIWPFGTTPPDLGERPSILEFLLVDRLMLGFVRSAIVAVGLYIVISIPALVVSKRWMKGLSTAGLTADDADTANKSIEVLQDALEATEDELQTQLEQNDIIQTLLFELHTQQEMGDDSLEKEGD